MPVNGTYIETDFVRRERMRGQLDMERSSFLSHWRELSDYILTRRARFTITDVNKGDRRNSKIIDNTPVLGVRTLRAGMMAGVTSPSRPWFMLTVPDPDLAEVPAVKVWLNTCTERIRSVFLRSNLYNSLPLVYGDLGVFATSALFIEEDFTGDVIRTTALPIGSYMIAQDHRRAVCVLIREYQLTVRQVINQFCTDEHGNVDLSNASDYVSQRWEIGDRETWVEVCHIIEPNDKWNAKRMESKYKKFSSVYYERGIGGSSRAPYIADQKTLSESGFDVFRLLCPRWEVTGEDVYGTNCPGMEALGDIKQLQLGERRLMQAIEKMINPPMSGPTALRSTKTSILPGDITHIDVREGQQGLQPIYQIDPRVQELEAKQAQVRERINRAFYADLFLMLAQSDRRQITAREIEERHEEKLLALGPVLEQLNADLLDPLIDITFRIMQSQNMIPPPPEELQGQPILVQYVSMMAQAQKLVGIAGIERLAGFTLQLAQVDPSVMKKINTHKMVASYADSIGSDPTLIRSDEEVDAMVQQEQQAAQAAAAPDAMASGAKTAKDLAGAKLDGDNALKRLLETATAGNLVPQR